MKNCKLTAARRHTSKSGHDIEKKIFSKCFSGHSKQLLHWSTLLKNQVKVKKHEIKSKNYWKTAKWRLYDVVRQSLEMIWKGKFFKMFLWSYWTTISMTNIALKSSYSALQGQYVQLPKNGKMTSINDVIRQKRDIIWRRRFFQNINLILLNNFCHHT